MLARLGLSSSCSRLVDLYWNNTGTSDDHSPSVSHDDFLPPDAQALSKLSFPIPENALESVAGACGRVLTPFCRYIGSTLTTDLETLVQSLHEADPNFATTASSNLTDQDDEEDDADIYVLPCPPQVNLASASLAEVIPQATSDSGNKPYSITTESCYYNGNTFGGASEPPSPQSPLLPFSSCSSLPSPSRPSRSIPRIIITPAPPQHFREMSSCVPVQDTSFGSRLTVPSHFALNASHPPLVAPCYPQAICHVSVRAWTYKYGHWCAVAPGIEEQERRGIFSRPLSARRRAIRKRVNSSLGLVGKNISGHAYRRSKCES